MMYKNNDNIIFLLPHIPAKHFKHFFTFLKNWHQLQNLTKDVLFNTFFFFSKCFLFFGGSFFFHNVIMCSTVYHICGLVLQFVCVIFLKMLHMYVTRL